jgi:hypothetical protein
MIAYSRVLDGISFTRELVGLKALDLSQIDVKNLLLLDGWIRVVVYAHFPVIEVCDNILAMRYLVAYHKIVTIQKWAAQHSINIGLTHYELNRDALMKNSDIVEFDKTLAKGRGLSQPLLEVYEKLYNNKPVSGT